MPFPVVPTLLFPFAASSAASKMRCVGMMRCAFLEICRRLFSSCPLRSKSFASSMKRSGARTTPLPIILIFPPWKMPEGMLLRTYFCPSNSRVCPAFGPPWNLATTSYLGVITSTTFPFPSSPHCSPRRTSTFPLFIFLTI